MKERKHGTPVLIDLASLASYGGFSEDPMHVVTTGTLFSGDHALFLEYTENQEDEETGQMMESEIHLELKKDQVTINRAGEYANVMMFRPNKRYETVYHTPFGDLPMSIYAHDVSCDLGKESGKIHLRYDLHMQGNYTSSNELHLEYRVQ